MNDTKKRLQSLGIPSYLRERLKKAADELGMKMYSMAEIAITQYLDNLDGKDDPRK